MYASSSSDRCHFFADIGERVQHEIDVIVRVCSHHRDAQAARIVRHRGGCYGIGEHAGIEQLLPEHEHAVELADQDRNDWRFAVADIVTQALEAFLEAPRIGPQLFAAFRLAWSFTREVPEVRKPALWMALLIGAGMGLLSGLVGVGGGIFLTPVLLLMNWSETKTAAGVSALFILVNSAAGLAGNYAQVSILPAMAAAWIAAAIAGGAVGSLLGAKRLESVTLRRVLAAVLLLASVKLIFT